MWIGNVRRDPRVDKILRASNCKVEKLRPESYRELKRCVRLEHDLSGEDSNTDDEGSSSNIEPIEASTFCDAVPQVPVGGASGENGFEF